MDSFETMYMYSYYLGQSSHLLFSFLKYLLLLFLRIFIKFSLKSLLLLQFPMDSFETRYTYSEFSGSVFTSSFQIFEMCISLGGGRIFIQFSFKLLLLLQYLMDSIEIRYWLPDFEIICGF